MDIYNNNGMFSTSEVDDSINRLPCHFNWYEKEILLPWIILLLTWIYFIITLDNLDKLSWEMKHRIPKGGKEELHYKLFLAYANAIRDQNSEIALKYCSYVLDNTKSYFVVEKIIARCLKLIIQRRKYNKAENECMTLISDIQESMNFLTNANKTEFELIKIKGFECLNKQVYHKLYEQVMEKYDFCDEARLLAINSIIQGLNEPHMTLDDKVYMYKEICQERHIDKFVNELYRVLPDQCSIPRELHESYHYVGEMTRLKLMSNKDSSQQEEFKRNIANTILTSMFNLDRSFTKFINAYCNYNKLVVPKKIYYPCVRPQPKDDMTKYGHKSEANKKTSLKRIQQRLSEMRIPTLPDYIMNFIAEHSPFFDDYYSFITDLSSRTNEHKHRKIMTEDLSETEVDALYKLAHISAAFSEKTVIFMSIFNM